MPNVGIGIANQVRHSLLRGGNMSKHSEKAIAKTAKRVTAAANTVKSQVKSDSAELMSQYDVIRKDLVKLKVDITKGYDMAKNLVDKRRTSVWSLINKTK
jgi:hypothetical protein